VSGRVTRRKHRAVNSEWHDWALLCSTPRGWCKDVRHEKWVANWQGNVLIYGPFDDLRRADCGCEFAMAPVCQVGR